MMARAGPRHHALRRPADDAAGLLAPLFPVAVHRASGACWFFLAVRALFKPLFGVGQEVFAVRARACRVVMIAAMYLDHVPHGLEFASKSWCRQGHDRSLSRRGPTDLD